MQTNSTAKPPVAVFLSASIVMFVMALSAADSVGFVPCQMDNTCGENSVALSSLPQLGIESTTSAGVEPVEIKIPSVGIDLPVQNPATTDVDVLDALLNKGPAHLVNSADLGQNGNVILFAHSSHLPLVVNTMFQAFNKVPDLEPGASIEIDGADGTAYLYTVDSVVKTTTDSGTTISLAPSQGKKLTLVTCDNLAGTSARFILTASFVGTIGAPAK